jgi:hypothetical protein
MVLAEDPKPGWSYFEYKYPDITPIDIHTCNNKCKHTAIIKKSIRVSFKIKAVVPLPDSLTNNSKLPVRDENPLNATITSNSGKNPGKQNKASKLENVLFRPAKHVLGNNVTTTDHSNIQTKSTQPNDTRKTPTRFLSANNSNERKAITNGCNTGFLTVQWSYSSGIMVSNKSVGKIQMPKSKQTFHCKICGHKKTSTDRRTYNAHRHKGLGLKKVKSPTVCTSCNRTIGAGKPIALYTQLPIPKTHKTPHLRLYANTQYKAKQIIKTYYGQVIERDKLINSEYTWKWSSNTVIDATNSTSLAKYANHYVNWFFPANAKLHNINIWSKKNMETFKPRERMPKDAEFKVPRKVAVLVATKTIEPGQEIFWNYGSGYWRGRNKLTPKDITKDNILWRENATENTRIQQTFHDREEKERIRKIKEKDKLWTLMKNVKEQIKKRREKNSRRNNKRTFQYPIVTYTCTPPSPWQTLTMSLQQTKQARTKTNQIFTPPYYTNRKTIKEGGGRTNTPPEKTMSTDYEFEVTLIDSYGKDYRILRKEIKKWLKSTQKAKNIKTQWNKETQQKDDYNCRIYVWDNTRRICKLIQTGQPLSRISVNSTTQQEMDRTRKKLKGKIATKKDNDSAELINNGDINKLDDGVWLNDSILNYLLTYETKPNTDITIKAQ